MIVNDIFTSYDELVKLVKDGHLFTFCVAVSLNKGHRNEIKDKKEFEFSVGDYNVKFIPDSMCFMLTHKIYIFRVITTYYQATSFIGDSEEELINEVLKELEKENNTNEED